MIGHHHLSPLTDVELLTRLCTESDDSELYEEFVKRFHSELTAECHKICTRRNLDKQIGNQIAHDCFEKVRKYKSFKADKVRIKDAHKAVIAFLNRIIINLFHDHQKTVRQSESANLNKSYFNDLLGESEIQRTPEELIILRERTVKIFQSLTPNERKVIETDLEHKRSHKYLPHDVNDLLAQELNVKKATIRKIRERAKDKIQSALNGN